ncbi:MAG: glycosyltransferase [Bacteroidota bacterium]
MVILHNYSIWLPQTQTWMYQQVRHMPPSFENHVVCETTDNLDQFEVPNIHSLDKKPGAFWDRALRDIRVRNHLQFLVDVALEQKASLLHSHFGHTGWANLGAARLANLKHVVTFYGLDVNYLPRKWPWKTRYRQLFREVDRVLCEGPFMARAIEALGCPEEKIKVHHLGVELSSIPFQPRHWDGKGPLKVLLAASFREKKGIPYALEALARIQGDVEITLIGDANAQHQQEKRRILEVIEKNRLNVRLMGYQPYRVLFEECYRHHLFLSPSVTAKDGDTEGGAPVSLIEMSASGMPVVSTTHCDIPEVIKHGESGLLAPERDVEGLAKHLQTLIEHPERWEAMGRAGRAHVEKEYDARFQGQRLGAIYDALMDS